MFSIWARPLHSRPLNELSWGVCVPASCGPGSVERLLATMLARSHLSSAGMRARIKITEDCQIQDQPRAAFMAILTAAALLGTYLNSRRDKTEPKTWILYGIRFLTISFIVLDHQLGIFNSGAISDGLQVDQDIMSIMGLFVLHDDLFVDTFFFLSGFLSATSFNKFKNFPNPLLFMLKRYVRQVI
ncbi:hypothetical protein MSG28_006980 [Choristoneura fumiferana]|uniref:Uncharacterized protein n=1 Tax=Choristoneura fumiferana TaxID=7141 RepID=A0ACC0JM29_CHOFU|nr:hypothetical protein MSG28_006980 [Choristoneura fumiferana]